MSDNNNDFSVGYKRPPRDKQFRKGQSGNPKGRPKHPTTPKECINKILSELRTVTIDGKRKKVTNLEILFRQMCTESLKGNLKAVDIMLKYFADSINIYGELYPPEIQSAEEMQRANEVLDFVKDLIAERNNIGE